MAYTNNFATLPGPIPTSKLDENFQDLSNATDAEKGAGLIGLASAVSYPTTSVGYKVLQHDTKIAELEGGTTGQALTKASNTDFDFAWATVTSSGSGVPAGGTTGQVLQKASNTDGDVTWATSGASDPLITSIAGLGSTLGVLEQTADNVAGIRAIGTATDSALPTWANVRNKCVTWQAASTPTGGSTSDVVLTTQEPNAMVLWQRNSGGTYDKLYQNVGTYAEMQAVSTPYDGQRWFVTTIDFGGSFTTFPLRTWYTYDGANLRWVADAAMSFSLINDPTAVTNSATITDVFGIVLPLKFVTQYMSVTARIRTRRVTGTTSYRPVIRFGASSLVDPTSGNNQANTYWRGAAFADCRSTNTLRFNDGSSIGLNENNAAATNAALTTMTADGTTALNFALGWAAADSSSTGTYEQCSITFEP